MVEAMEILEMYCDLLLARLENIIELQTQKQIKNIEYLQAIQ